MSDAPNDTLGDLFRASQPKPGTVVLTDENRAAITAIVRRYVVGEPAERDRIQTWVETRGGSFVSLGQKYASYAVRERDPAWVELGFVAVATSVRVAHPYEAAKSFALLWHSAVKLGVNPDEIAARVERLVGGDRAETMVWYRAYGDKDIAVFGMEEGMCPSGFLYTSFK
jgi:hypothetical protein